MRLNNWIKCCLGFSLLFLFSSVAFADASTGAVILDTSKLYLAMIFGQVGSSLSGLSDQHTLGHLFSMYNKGILIAAGVILLYSTVTTVMYATHEGSMQSQNRKTALVILRVALGVACLVPSSNGYCIAQRVVMDAVVQGVNLANRTWDSGLDYFQDHSVWNVTGSTQDAGNNAMSSTNISDLWTKIIFPTGTVGLTAPLPLVTSVFASEVCMYNSVAQAQNKNIQSSQISTSSSDDAVSGYIAPKMHYSSKSKGSSLYFPKSADPSGDDCGQLILTNASGQNKLLSKNTDTYKRAQIVIAHDIANAMLPAAKQAVCAGGNYDKTALCEGVPSSDVTTTLQLGWKTAMINTMQVLQPLISIPKTPVSGSDSNRSDLLHAAKQLGWANAGRYYWDVARLTDNNTPPESTFNDMIAAGTVVADGSKNTFSELCPQSGHKSAACTVLGGATNLSNRTLGSFLKSFTTAPVSASTNANTNTNTGIAGGNPGVIVGQLGLLGGTQVALLAAGTAGTGSILIASSLGTLLVHFVSLLSSFGPNMIGYDPIDFLYKIGNQLLNTAGDLLVCVLMTVGITSSLTAICQDTYNADENLRDIAASFMPFLIGIFSMCFIAGAVLDYWVPMIPFVIFFFTVLGWLAYVIEAMAAAPLIALGITHPEGHDFLGKGEQGIMMLLGVFLQPVLLVIGLIAAMILSYVALRMFNFTYGNFLGDLMGPANSSTSKMGVMTGTGDFFGESIYSAVKSFSLGGIIIRIFFVMPILLLIYTYIVYMIISQCFNLVSSLKDSVMNWIGVRQQSAIDAIGTSKQIGQMVGSGAGKAMDMGGKDIGAAKDPRASEKGKMKAPKKGAK